MLLGSLTPEQKEHLARWQKIGDTPASPDPVVSGGLLILWGLVVLGIYSVSGPIAFLFILFTIPIALGAAGFLDSKTESAAPEPAAAKRKKTREAQNPAPIAPATSAGSTFATCGLLALAAVGLFVACVTACVSQMAHH